VPTSTILPIFLQAGCPSYRTSNNVKVLKAKEEEKKETTGQKHNGLPYSIGRP